MDEKKTIIKIFACMLLEIKEQTQTHTHSFFNLRKKKYRILKS